jgi:hypothetical protein
MNVLQKWKSYFFFLEFLSKLSRECSEHAVIYLFDYKI